jgi:hypothetical protein
VTSDAKSLEEISRLEGDHREANDLHASVERLHSTWIASGELTSSDALQLKSQTERLKQLYSDHIVVEETIVFARADPSAGQSRNRGDRDRVSIQAQVVSPGPHMPG